MSYQPPVIIEPTSAHKASVIWLHGLGADGHDFEAIAPMLGVDSLGIRFIFPHANVHPVTINGGMACRSWYDIKGLDIDSRADSEGIKESVNYVDSLINIELMAGIPSNKIIIAGFSQGGVVAYHAALKSEHQLAGIMALSTYLPDVDALSQKLSPANKQIPIFQGHGTQDPVVQLLLGEAANKQLNSWGYQPEWHTYPMPHAVINEEIADIGNWLKRILSEN
jgi:phospholipase/carboxylesterase